MSGCQCLKYTYCNCLERKGSSTILFENVKDVGESLSAVMVACGIHVAKAKAARDIIIESFLHFDKVHNRMEAIPHKHIKKEDLMSDLGKKCLMNRSEGHLAYTIIKRAFKAFYSGTESYDLRNPYLEQQRIHKQECLWVHAASRTIQVYASLEQYLPKQEKDYRSKIKKIYKHLYNRMKERAQPLTTKRECECQRVARSNTTDWRRKRVCGLVTNPLKISLNSEAIDKNHKINKKNFDELVVKDSDLIRVTIMQEKPFVPTLSHMSINLPFCNQCRCPKLNCQCDVENDTGLLVQNCGAGPFQCQWFRKDTAYVYENGQLELHECPVDCDDLPCPEDNVICIGEDESERPPCSEMSGIESDDKDEAMEELLEEQKLEIEEFDSTTGLPEPLSRYPTPKYGGCRVSRTPVKEEDDGDKDVEVEIKLEETYSDMLRRLAELAKLGRGPPPPPFDIAPNRNPIFLRSSKTDSFHGPDDQKKKSTIE